ncbi:unnamed protein product [Closterium sp. NIES-54]
MITTSITRVVPLAQCPFDILFVHFLRRPRAHRRSHRRADAAATCPLPRGVAPRCDMAHRDLMVLPRRLAPAMVPLARHLPVPAACAFLPRSYLRLQH